jgi:hypothetical protein
MLPTSFWFALGHQYQALWIISIIFPYLSFFVAKRQGILTMMLLHIFFDNMAVLGIVYLGKLLLTI